jgi:mono/diheme cytochrome c family protein
VTWDARFQAHLRGEAIAVPYPGIDVTDAEKRSAALSSYRNVVLGAAPRDGLIDIRDVFSEDAALKLSFVPWPMSDGRAILQQMCARCHDGRGDPALEKNQFDVLRLDEMSRAMKDRAIARIEATGVARMPPWRVGDLTPEAMNAAVAELQK